MAKSEAVKSDKISPFWKPQVPGDSIKGVFVCFQPTKMPDGDTGLAIELDGGRLVPVSWVVKHILQELKAETKKTFKAGDKLHFTYTGKGGKAKIIEIRLNGKLLPRPSAFAPASSEAVDDFLSAPDKRQKGKGEK